MEIAYCLILLVPAISFLWGSLYNMRHVRGKLWKNILLFLTGLAITVLCLIEIKY